MAIHSGSTIFGVEPGGSSPLAPTKTNSSPSFSSESDPYVLVPPAGCEAHATGGVGAPAPVRFGELIKDFYGGTADPDAG